MLKTEKMLIEWEITKVIHDFNYFLDRSRYDDLASLFTEDCEFDRLGEILQGHSGILNAYRNRHPFLTRHMPANIRFTHIDPFQVEGNIYCADFVGQPLTGDLPVLYQLSQPVFVEFDDIYRLTDKGWRIHRRRTSFIMKGADMPTS